MTDSPNLAITYLAASQSQKHVTVNDALIQVDALLQGSVKDKDLATPPGSPADGDRYIIAASPTGAWSGKSKYVTVYADGAWVFYNPKEGWTLWVDDENKFLVYDGSNWVDQFSSTNLSVLYLGVGGATADATNRLSVNSPAVLFNHAGTNMQLKLNKNAAGDTASVVFQTGFSGRAEFGLTGDDNFSMKVSPDGSTFYTGVSIDKDSGILQLPASIKMKTADQTAIGTAYADVTELGFSLEANTSYMFDYTLIADADATTTGIDVAVNGPTAPTAITYEQVYWTSATARTERVAAAYDNDTASTASNGTAARIFRVRGVIRNGANAGTLIPRAKREAVGSGPNIRTGSYGILLKIA